MNYFLKKISIVVFCIFFQSVPVFGNVSEFFTVFSMYLKKPSEVGEIAPMSKSVGQELVKYVRNMNQKEPLVAKNYLEAGGGCGAVSVCIAKYLNSKDRLDIIEINPEMCAILRERLKSYPNVFIHCCSILDWNPTYQYDAIISTLPFLSLGVDFAQDTIKHFMNLAHKDCIVSCVEYPIAVVFRRVMHGLRIKSDDFIAVQKYMAFVRQQYLKEAVMIYYNVPPINVYHLSFKE